MLLWNFVIIVKGKCLSQNLCPCSDGNRYFSAAVFADDQENALAPNDWLSKLKRKSEFLPNAKRTTLKSIAKPTLFNLSDVWSMEKVPFGVLCSTSIDLVFFLLIWKVFSIHPYWGLARLLNFGARFLSSMSLLCWLNSAVTIVPYLQLKCRSTSDLDDLIYLGNLHLGFL